jgi:hypothetical protein
MGWTPIWNRFSWDHFYDFNPWGGHHGGPKKGAYYELTYLDARSPDGHNNDGDNNPLNDKGVHDGTFLRITPNSYPDGIGSLPAQSAGLGIAVNGPLPTPSQPGNTGKLPSPRAVSDAVMAQGTTDIPNSFGVNEFHQFFGQALTHDLAEAATGASGDPFTFLAALFPFGRTPYEIEDGARQQINEETSYLDLSMVYGNSETMLNLVRADLRDKWGNPILDHYGNRIQSAKLLEGDEDLLPTIQQVADDTGLGRYRSGSTSGVGALPARRLRRAARSEQSGRPPDCQWQLQEPVCRRRQPREPDAAADLAADDLGARAQLAGRQAHALRQEIWLVAGSVVRGGARHHRGGMAARGLYRVPAEADRRLRARRV